MELKEEYYFYLDLLRESGEINMLEAPRHLRDEFGLTKAEALVMFSAWMTHKQEQRNG